MRAYQDRQLTALGDATRRAILGRLVDAGPLSVNEIADGLPVSRPAVSQHLRVLMEADLLTVREAGTRRLYAVNPDAIESLRGYFDRFWTRSLTAFARKADASARRKKR